MTVESEKGKRNLPGNEVCKGLNGFHSFVSVNTRHMSVAESHEIKE